MVGLLVSALGRAQGSRRPVPSEKLSNFIPDLLRETGVPGLSVSLILDAGVAWTQGFGIRSVDSKEPVDADTVFEAASLSKPAFAYVVLRLAEQGKLKLDAPLSDYLAAAWMPNEPRLKLITARMVLSHTSGLPHGRAPGSPIAIRFEPGSKFAYSSNGIEYLRAVAEEVSGKHLPELMQSMLLGPLRVERSSFGWRDSFHANSAQGHARNNIVTLSGNGEMLEATPEEKKKMAADYPEYRYPSASAGLYTTAGDYARFVCAMLRPSAAGLLSARMTAEMLSPQTRINENVSWALGWGIETTDKGTAFWHWGDWGVYRNFVIGYPATGEGAVVLTNSFHGPNAYRRIISEYLPGDHPAFPWVERYRP